MLEQTDIEAIGRTIGVAADEMQDAIKHFGSAAIAFADGECPPEHTHDGTNGMVTHGNTQDSEDGYIWLTHRVNIGPEPDKRDGFTFVGNDTWLPKHLVNARRCQQRKFSRIGENGIVWTR